MIDKTLKERGDRYGSFETGAEIMQALKSVAAQHDNWEKMPAYQREAIEMIFHKIGRAINGDSNYIDNWHDIQGFAKLVEDVLSEKNATKNS